MLRCVRDTDMQLGRLAPTRIIPEVIIIMILVSELARGLESPNLLFLSVSYRKALPGWHRGVWPGETAHRHQSSSITSRSPSPKVWGVSRVSIVSRQ
jgi:hypothetical protein